MHVEIPNRANCPDDGGWSISEATVVGTLDHRDGWGNRAVEQVNRILSVKLQPLAIVNWDTACNISQRIELERFATVCRFAG